MTSAVVLGGSGMVGSRLCETWLGQGKVVAPTHADVDVLDTHALAAFLTSSSATNVVNLAAWADVDGAEIESGNTSGRVFLLNADFPGKLAEICRRLGKHLVHVSTDYVFDGTNSERPYREDDPPRALAWYAETKRRGEVAVLEANEHACVARIEMPYTGMAHPKRDLSRLIASRFAQGQSVQGVTDQNITPVFLDDAAAAMWHLASDGYSGIVHVAASDWTTPYEFAAAIARRLGLSQELIEPVPFEDFATTRPARRPQHSWLDVTRFTTAFGGGILRPVHEALEVWIRQWLSQNSKVF